jgi:hypothetical protein
VVIINRYYAQVSTAKGRAGGNKCPINY